MEHFGYKYVKCGKGPNDTTYYKCAYAKNAYCRAKGKQIGSLEFTVTVPHNHPIYEERDGLNGLSEFKEALKRKAASKIGPLVTIYEAEARRFPLCAAIYPWKTAETLMRRARKTTLPSIPTNLYNLSVLFENGQLGRYTTNGELLYKGCVRDTDGKYSIIFACQSLVDMILLLNPNELHADATFKVVPSKPWARQLLVLHCMVDNYSVPVVYCLMESKTLASYDKVIAFIMPNYHPRSIVTDFESALRDTIASYFDTAEPYGCWFHHNQAVWKNMRRFGYLPLINRNDKALKCLRMLMALPLLPANKIENGFLIIKAYANRFNVNLTRLFHYYNRYWLINVGVNIIYPCTKSHEEPTTMWNLSTTN